MGQAEERVRLGRDRWRERALSRGSGMGRTGGRKWIEAAPTRYKKAWNVPDTTLISSPIVSRALP